MFCGECGAELRSDAVKCPVCGTNVREHYVPQEGGEERAVEYQPEMDTGINDVHNVYSEEGEEPITHIQMESRENPAAPAQNANQEEQSGQMSGKSSNNINWIWIVVVLMLLGLAIGMIMMQISGKQEDNTFDESYNDTYADSENEEQYDDEDSEDDAYEFSEEDDWMAVESDDDLTEEEIPELRAALELSYDEIDPATLPTGETCMMLIGEYIYVSRFGEESGITVMNQDLEIVAQILSDKASWFTTDGKYIYYKDGLHIYRADPDGTHVTEMVTDEFSSVCDMVPINGFLYYSCYDEEEEFLNKMDMDSGNVERLYTGKSVWVRRYNDHVDFRDENGEYYNADTGEPEEEEEASWPVFATGDDDYVEYLMNDEGTELYAFAEGEIYLTSQCIGDYFCCVSYIEDGEDVLHRVYLYKISANELCFL
ncbi:MAG: DUF5050 domain-containing protein [Lachnospiraceae bacterium]|nr:DUF5050 domain-containing protein [bacterium]MDY5516509.1 DUF5050 domain-containing protein [Lachnospiraceae bacterium]